MNKEHVLENCSSIIFKFTDAKAEKYLLDEVEKRATKYWLNKDGEKVDISTMSDDYLLNCLNLVRRYKQSREDWLDRLAFECIHDF